ncbi:MAG: hypothetical protein Q7I97_00230 [Thermovirgaceae bacterium]|nr:hypothetical protein [Thermovirgaceae bacterium]
MNDVMMTALEAAAKLEMPGHRAAVVGGAVRDTILGREVRDADVATSATMEEIVSVWPDSRLIGKPPKTTALLVIGGKTIDVSSFQGKSLEEDLGRRDLTINSIAMTPAGKIIDPWKGATDIASGILRFTGNPLERLKEDPLRAVRLARFAALLPHFLIDPASTAACPLFAPDIASVPFPRMGKEVLFALEGDLQLFLESLEALGILEPALPFFGSLPVPAWSETLRRMSLAGKMTADRGVRAAALLADAGEKAGRIAVSWGWPRSLVRDIENLTGWRFLTWGKMDPEIFGRLFRTRGPKWIDRLFLLGLIDCLAGRRERMKTWTANRVKASEYSLRLISFANPLTGKDIIRLAGTESGPLIGEALSALDGAIAGGIVEDRESALLWAGTWIRNARREFVF